MWNMRCDKLKSKIRWFATDYSRRLNLVRLAKQAAYEEKDDRAIKSCDSGEVDLVSAELAPLLIMKDQPLVVRAGLKRMSPEASSGS